MRLAKAAEFIQRKPRKIDACNLLSSICEEGLAGSPSYNDLASHIEANHDKNPSKQAVAKRMDDSFEKFVQSLLENAISQKANLCAAAAMFSSEAFRGYQRVLVQDSTVIMLPKSLFPVFSGVSNASSSVCNARIQAVYDLMNGRMMAFAIDPYSKNDLTAAPELEICEGDLVLRDRGYLIADELQRHRDIGADCIYRHKTGFVYLDVKNRQPVNLPALLRKRGRLDMEVLLNNEAQTRVRLVAAPVDEETANKRRMKAKKETRGHNPSQAVLELMSWTIFITTIPKSKATFNEILAMYGLRWRIEVIFKAWKSHMKFHVVHQVSEIQLKILLKARLLVIAACANTLYRFCGINILANHGRRLSLLKFMKYLSNPSNIIRVVRSISGTQEEMRSIHKVLAKYCCYDKRRRLNYLEMWDLLH